MKIKPLNSHILIEVEKEETTRGGIIIATSNETVTEHAKVIGVADDVTLVKVGDTIVYKAYSLSRTKLDDKEYAFLKVEEVLGVEQP